jgi:hypothetical protein
LYSRRNVGRIVGYETEVAYTKVGEGREQDAEALQRQRQIKRQVRMVGYLLRVALVILQPRKISCSRFLAQATDSTALPKNIRLING